MPQQPVTAFTTLHPPAINKCKRPAFTLVELLVVVSIIGLLISILLPALQKARESARAVACASNLRQSVMSMINYANDYNDVLTPFRGTSNFFWYKLLRTAKYGGGTFMCPAGNFNESWTNGSPAKVRPPGFSSISTSYSDLYYPPPFRQTDRSLARFFEDRFGTPRHLVSIDRTNYGANSSSSSSSWYTGAASLPIQSALAMPNSGSTATSAGRKPNLTRAFKPSETAVIFDGVWAFRFDYPLWGIINLRHYNSTTANFSYMDGHADIRDWLRVPPGKRPDRPTPRRAPSDHISQIDGQLNNGGAQTQMLRALLDKPTDVVALDGPVASSWGMRFIVPKTPVIANGQNHGD